MKRFNTIDCKEIHAASMAVQEAADDHSPLSGYIGSSSFGGTWCVALEAVWRETFGTKHAIAVNSATSGLLAACMAVGVEHNDEVIVSPYTMSATAAAPKILGAKIVFADIEPETFSIDPVEVSNAITPKTKAVIATNLFGHPAHLHELRGGILGLNLRMTEVTAAMAYEQLQKAEHIIESRIDFAEAISYHAKKKGLPITPPVRRDGCDHVYYCWAGLLQKGPIRELPEPFRRGYMAPLWSWNAFKTKFNGWEPAYQGVVEKIEREIVLVEICSIDPTDSEIIQMVEQLGRA